MTQQIPDTILMNGRELSIVGVNGGDLFVPRSIGVIPIATVTSCHRGYVCQYKISNDKLILDELLLSIWIPDESKKGQEFFSQQSFAINGISPTTPKDKFVSLKHAYEGLNLEVQFTGGILAGEGFIDKFYPYMSFLPVWNYQAVFELMFDKGKILEIRNVSAQVEEIRNKMSELPLEPDIPKANKQEIESWIKKAFRLDYGWNVDQFK